MSNSFKIQGFSPNALKGISFLLLANLRLYFHGNKSTDPNARLSYVSHSSLKIHRKITELVDGIST
jgi:hypothetical protein